MGFEHDREESPFLSTYSMPSYTTMAEFWPSLIPLLTFSEINLFFTRSFAASTWKKIIMAFFILHLLSVAWSCFLLSFLSMFLCGRNSSGQEAR